MFIIKKLKELGQFISESVKFILNYLAHDEVTALFLTLFMFGWFANNYAKEHLDLDMLLKAYGVFKTAHLFEFTVNSKYNSPDGAPYIKPGQSQQSIENKDIKETKES